MKATLRRIGCLLPLCLAAACVSQGKYDAKVAELERTRTALDRERRAHTSDEQKASELSNRLEQAKASLLVSEQAGERLALEVDDRAQHAAELAQALGDRASTVAALEAQLAEQRRLIDEFEALGVAYGAATPADLQRAVQRLERRVRETEQALAQAAQELEREKRISSKLQTLIDAGKLRVRRRSGRLAIELPGDIHFASGSPKLTDVGKSTLRELAGVLQAETDRLFMIEGHTDNVPIAVSGFRNNFDLGSARAESARDFLVQSGLDAKRNAIASWADLLPACPEVDEPDCQSRNRRVEVVLLPRFE